MYNNIGEKIKTLAKVIAWLGIIGSIIWGIILIVQGEQVSSYSSYLSGAGSTLTGTGIAVMILGSLGSWISSWALYAIGDTNVKTTEIYNRSLRNSNTGVGNTYSKPDYSGTATHKFRCEKCGSMISEFPCSNCGYNPESGVRKCPKCGNQLADGELFCSECGTKVDENGETALIGKCEMCNKENTSIRPVKIVDEMGTRHRKVCDECLKKYNCQPE